MSEESKLRSDVVAALKPLLAFPVENTAHVGCPDVCCLLGWIEIKIAERPQRPDTRVRVKVRPSQRLWIRNWCSQRGRAWWLTKLSGTRRSIRDLWTLHDGLLGADHLDHWTEREMEEQASWHLYTVQRVALSELTTVLLRQVHSNK